jgi:hypothetical protein
MKIGRIITVILAVLIIGLIVYFYPQINRQKAEISKSIILVPVNANMITEIRAPFEFMDFFQTQPAFWDDLIQSKAFSGLNSHMIWLDSIANEFETIHTTLDNSSLVISVHDIGKHKLGCLIITELPGEVKAKKMLEELNSLHSEDSPSQRTYENHKIYDYPCRDGNNYSVSIVNHNLLISDNSLLVEDAIRQSNLKQSLLDNKPFKEVYATAGQKELANIYLNLARLDHLSLPFLRKDMESHHPALRQYASWAELDLSLSESLISLNGFAIASDSSSTWLNHITKQPPVRADFQDVLPENTAMFFALSTGKMEAFIQYRKTFLEEYHHPRYYDEKIQEFTNKTGSDFEQFILSLTGQQVCIALSNINELNIYQNAYLLVETKSASQSEKQIRDFLKTYVDHTSQDLSDYYGTIKMDEKHSFPMYTLPVVAWPEVFYGSMFRQATPRVVTILENTLVFAPDKTKLKRLLNEYLLNRTIAKNKNFQAFSQNLSREYQTYFYLNNNLGFSWLKSLLNTRFSDQLTAQKAIVQKHQQIAIQQIVSDEMIYHNIAIRHRNYQSDKPHTVWESRLDTTLLSKPAIVENHENGQKEIFIQDVSGKIYLINQKGHILWKLPLEEPILSDIYQIDRYNNGNLQYLFNTKSRIYLIDRLGNHVDRFPVNLRSPASCGLALFDYDNNKKYRILVPAENKVIFMYNKEGNLVPGWEFEQTEYPLTITPQHIRDGNKDYIAFHDKYRIYLLNRRGQIRVQPNEQFSASVNNRFYFEEKSGNQKSALVTTTTDGTIKKVYMDGSIETLHLKTFSPDHHFMYYDLDCDGIRDYIYLDGKELIAYNKGKSIIMNYRFDNDIENAPNFYRFSQKNHEIGITDQTKEMIYLINAGGELHQGFPLIGLSPFSITYLHTGNTNFNLFVGGQDSFLYNYEVK